MCLLHCGANDSIFLSLKTLKPVLIGSQNAVREAEVNIDQLMTVIGAASITLSGINRES